jgi:hypothetical protein
MKVSNIISKYTIIHQTINHIKKKNQEEKSFRANILKNFLMDE